MKPRGELHGLAMGLLLLALIPRSLPAQPALQWEDHESSRRARLTVGTSGKNGFMEVPASLSGIGFTNLLSEERSLTNQIFLNGSGVAAGDFDRDGLCDLYFCGLDSPNRLFRNLGAWRFEDVTSAAGLECADQASTGAAFADVDGDGDLDLLVNGIARGTRLFLNAGQGKFREATAGSGLESSRGSASLALADIDGDGRLDLYVVNYRNDTMRDMPDVQFTVAATNGAYRLLTVNGRPATAPDLIGRFTFDQASGVLENGEPDMLFRNLGDGRFQAVSWTDGVFLSETGERIEPPNDWGLSAMFRDLDGDRAPDLYVCNDFQSPDRIWMNDGQGRFRAMPAHAIRQTSLFSMGVDFADIDRDGHDDFFVADMLSRDHTLRQVQVMDALAFAQVRQANAARPQFPRNTLFRSRGNGTYAELAQLSGLDASEWSWCPAFLDVDLDGYEDLLVTTGHWRDAQNADVAREVEHAKRQASLPFAEQLRLRKRFPRLDTPNVAFRNRGDLTFEDSGARWGFDSRRVSHGMALADLDNDGDLDVVINCLNDGALVLRNDAGGNRIAVRLAGQPPNTSGIGARVRVLAPNLPAQTQEFLAGGRYLSSDDAVRTFAAGAPTNRLTIEVSWRSGRRTVVDDAEPNHLYVVREPEGPDRTADTRRPEARPPPFFEDATQLLGHQHADEPFDDFNRQPLLPRKLSQLGPGVAWFDYNSDGWDDLLIGTGRGGRLGVFRNDGGRGFVRQRAAAFDAPMPQDLSTVLGWQPNSTNLVLLLGLTNYEKTATNAPAFRAFSVVSGASDETLYQSGTSTGPLAMGDVDGDGDLELFVGGRVNGGRYPEPVSSVLLRNQGGQLHPDAEASKALAGVGMVSSALFTDLDGDGRPELVLACDWGAVRVFRDTRGKLSEWDWRVVWENQRTSHARVTLLSKLTGWWNSVTAGDFDNDGRLDLVAGNWGRNTYRQRFAPEPLRLYFTDPYGNGTFALLEAHHDSYSRRWVPARDWGTLSAVFPGLREKFPTYTAFGRADLREVLEADLPPMRQVTAQTLDSVLLLNRGDFFEVRPLPIAAQVSPVFGLVAGDLDGDGNEDLFLAQNFFEVSRSESRQDAGCGLWLRGDGRGQFEPVPPSESGIELYGEGRGAALSDFDHDGRLDLVAGQNGGPTKLLRNAKARPGLRVQLSGPPENPAAAGAVVRAVFEDGTLGPAQEIRLGGGYWSQDSNVLILGLPRKLQELEIRWPGGWTERVEVLAGTGTLSRSVPPGSNQN